VAVVCSKPHRTFLNPHTSLVIGPSFLLITTPESIIDAVRPPLQGEALWLAFPGLKPWAVLLSSFRAEQAVEKPRRIAAKERKRRRKWDEL
jgi:hypothetical protein